MLNKKTNSEIDLRKLSLAIAIFLLFVEIGNSIYNMITVNFAESLILLVLGDVLAPIIIVIAIYYGKNKFKKWRYALTAYVIIYGIVSFLVNSASLMSYYFSSNALFYFWDIYVNIIIYVIVNLLVIYKKHLKLVDLICLSDFLFGLIMFIYGSTTGDLTSSLHFLIYHMIWSLMYILLYPTKGYTRVLTYNTAVSRSTRALFFVPTFVIILLAIVHLIMGLTNILTNSIFYNHFELITAVLLLTLLWIILIYYNTRINDEDIENRSKLEETSKNNEILLSEVHHRVKNNLAVLSSFSNLTKKKLTDKEAIDAISDIQNRIKAMGLVHADLYETLNFGEVNAQKYITELCNDLYNSMADEDVNLDLNIEDVNLDIDIISPIGLIIVESITNSFKHAFPKGKGTVTVTLKEENDDYKLVIADNGIGCTLEDLNASKSMGNKIINILVAQIDGKIDMEINNGLKRTIIFKNKENSQQEINQM